MFPNNVHITLYYYTSESICLDNYCMNKAVEPKVSKNVTIMLSYILSSWVPYDPLSKHLHKCIPIKKHCGHNNSTNFGLRGWVCPPIYPLVEQNTVGLSLILTQWKLICCLGSNYKPILYRARMQLLCSAKCFQDPPGNKLQSNNYHRISHGIWQ